MARPSLPATGDRGLTRGRFSQTASDPASRESSGIPALPRRLPGEQAREGGDKRAAGDREGRRARPGWIHFRLCRVDSEKRRRRDFRQEVSRSGGARIPAAGRARPAAQGPGRSQPPRWDELPRLLLGEGSAGGRTRGPASARAMLFTFPPRSPGKPRVPTLMEAGRSLRTPHLGR